MSETVNIYIHPSAHIDPRAKIGKGTKVWINAQIREDAIIGQDCVIGKDVYIDRGVIIGDRTKIQNGALLYLGLTVGDDVFIGPNTTFTNDKVPRAFEDDWKVTPTHVEEGASIGANATIICGVNIGRYAMVGAGSVVTKNVEDFTLVIGNPARPKAIIDEKGNVQKHIEQ